MSSPIERNEVFSPQQSPSPDAAVQENVNTHFDATVSYWDEVYRDQDLQSIIYQQRQAAVLSYVDAANVGPAGRVLEIGCGAGHLTVALARCDFQVNAVDASPGMVDLTARRCDGEGYGERVSVSQADVHALPFDSGEFDLVVAVGVIPWLHSPSEAVCEMARVLRPGGELVLTADNAARLMSFTDPRGLLALSPLRRIYHRLRHRPDQAVSRLHFPRAVRRFLRGAGLQPRAQRTIGFGPFTLLGRPLLGDRRAVALDRRLQALADRGVPVLRGTGWHYVARAVKLVKL
jgi:ubiquinone/menaquinone biosynthesis C-methylase UbiE